jgi:hypothetical protein
MTTPWSGVLVTSLTGSCMFIDGNLSQSFTKRCLDTLTVPHVDLKQVFCASHAYGNALATKRCIALPTNGFGRRTDVGRRMVRMIFAKSDSMNRSLRFIR